MRQAAVVMMFFLAFLSGCYKEPASIPPLPPDQSAPTLSYPFASFATVTRFIPFGDSITGQGLNAGYWVQFSDTTGAILAACSGIVTSITPDTTGGSSFIAVKYKPASIYSFLYGGVNNVQVHVSDTLNAGSILGKINSSGRVYFQLTKNGNQAFCPQTYGSPGFNTAIVEAIARNNAINPNDSIGTPCLLQMIQQ